MVTVVAEGKEDQLNEAMIVDLARPKNLLRRSACQKRADDEHGNRCTEGRNIGKSHHDGLGNEKSRDSLHEEEDNADGAGDCSEVDEDLSDSQLDVVATSRQNRDTPSPDHQIEADHEPRPHKSASCAKERFEDWNPEESRVAENGGKLRELSLIGVLKAAEGKEGKDGQKGVGTKTEKKRQKTEPKRVRRVVHADEGVDDQRGLSDGDDQPRKVFGRHGGNDSSLARYESNDQHEKEGGNHV